MLESVTRCPSVFFDTISSGVLVNKFSTDLGVLDNTLFTFFMYILRCPTLVLVSFVNVFQINTYLIAPVSFLLLISILLFGYTS